MARMSAEEELVKLEAELEEKKKKLEEKRVAVNSARYEAFQKWCKKNDIDEYQLYRYAITSDWEDRIREMYAEMIKQTISYSETKPTKKEKNRISKNPTESDTSNDNATEDNTSNNNANNSNTPF